MYPPDCPRMNKITRYTPPLTVTHTHSSSPVSENTLMSEESSRTCQHKGSVLSFLSFLPSLSLSLSHSLSLSRPLHPSLPLFFCPSTQGCKTHMVEWTTTFPLLPSPSLSPPFVSFSAFPPRISLRPGQFSGPNKKSIKCFLLPGNEGVDLIRAQ